MRSILGRGSYFRALECVFLPVQPTSAPYTEEGGEASSTAGSPFDCDRRSLKTDSLAGEGDRKYKAMLVSPYSEILWQ
jgi:hypothetical protein